MGILPAEEAIFQRTELLLGREKMREISRKRVILFGIGGVGSWCAEGLIRSGINHLTLVDSDRVCASNINRQVQATCRTIGRIKTEALKERLLEINPHAEIHAVQARYDEDSEARFEWNRYDYILDAIDSIQNKIRLIRTATRTDTVFFSAMGASLKLDPTRVRVAEFWKVKGCPLGARIRKLIRKGPLPAKEFLCVYSEELRDNQGVAVPGQVSEGSSAEAGRSLAGGDADDGSDDERRPMVINGTAVHVTAVFGFTLAGLVLQDI